MSIAPAALADEHLRTDLDFRVGFEPVCVGATVPGQINGITIRRSDTGPQYPDGATLTLTVLPISQPSVGTIAVTITDGTVVLPDDWTSQSFPFTASDVFEYAATFTATSAGLLSGEVTWMISVNGGIPEPVPGLVLPVFVVDCPTPTPTPTDAPAPTPPLPTMPPTDAAGPGGRSDSGVLLVVGVVGLLSAAALLLKPHRGRCAR